MFRPVGKPHLWRADIEITKGLQPETKSCGKLQSVRTLKPEAAIKVDNTGTEED